MRIDRIDKEPYERERTSLLTVSEACKILRVHRNTVYAMIHDGRLRAFKLHVGSNSSWRIKLEDVAALEDA